MCWCARLHVLLVGWWLPAGVQRLYGRLLVAVVLSRACSQRPGRARLHSPACYSRGDGLLCPHMLHSSRGRRVHANLWGPLLDGLCCWAGLARAVKGCGCGLTPRAPHGTCRPPPCNPPPPDRGCRATICGQCVFPGRVRSAARSAALSTRRRAAAPAPVVVVPLRAATPGGACAHALTATSPL